jgi:hypothetical protein
MTHRRARIAALPLSLLAGVGVLSACEGSDPPSDLCKNIASLSSATTTFQGTPVSKATMPTLSSSLKQLDTALDGLAEESGGEFSTEIKAVETTATALRSSIAAETAQPTVANRGQVMDDRSAFVAAVKNLDEKSSSSC